MSCPTIVTRDDGHESCCLWRCKQSEGTAARALCPGFRARAGAGCEQVGDERGKHTQSEAAGLFRKWHYCRKRRDTQTPLLQMGWPTMANLHNRRKPNITSPLKGRGKWSVATGGSQSFVNQPRAPMSVVAGDPNANKLPGSKRADVVFLVPLRSQMGDPSAVAVKV